MPRFADPEFPHLGVLPVHTAYLICQARIQSAAGRWSFPLRKSASSAGLQSLCSSPFPRSSLLLLSKLHDYSDSSYWSPTRDQLYWPAFRFSSILRAPCSHSSSCFVRSTTFPSSRERARRPPQPTSNRTTTTSFRDKNTRERRI